MKIFLTYFFLFLIAFVKISEARNLYTIAVVPQFPPTYLQENWGKILQAMEEETGLKFELIIYKSIPEFEKGFLAGEPDFAFMNPYHMVMAKRAQGYLPLLRDTKPLTGILVVRVDSPFKKVEDLNGKKIGFPAPNAYGASLYMRAILTEVFKIKFEPLYLKTHDNVYRNVVLGEVSAGGGVNQTFQRQPEEVKKQLRILYETPPSAPHPLAVHPRVPKEVRKKFFTAFLKLSKREDLKPYFNNIQIPNPIEADYVRDYKPLEKLKLEKYVVLEN
jgi:phosphonate transport system substrate-binding protein